MEKIYTFTDYKVTKATTIVKNYALCWRFMIKKFSDSVRDSDEDKN